MSILPVCLHGHYMYACLVPTEIRKGGQIPWNWNYGGE